MGVEIPPFTIVLNNMKKEKKKYNKIIGLTAICLLGGLFCVGAVYTEPETHQVKASEKLDVEYQPRYATYNDETYTITLTADEVNNYKWENLAEISSLNTYILSFTYDSQSYQFDDFDDGWYYYAGNGDTRIYFNIEHDSFDTQKFLYRNDNFEFLDFEYDLILNSNSTNYDDLKSAIELDIQANSQPDYTDMGEQIIDTISSGLGLIGDLAQELLTGFSTLFWNSTNSTLTNFGTFALVFLGIAITMAVVKLCLAIIRGSTGA